MAIRDSKSTRRRATAVTLAVLCASMLASASGADAFLRFQSSAATLWTTQSHKQVYGICHDPVAHSAQPPPPIYWPLLPLFMTLVAQYEEYADNTEVTFDLWLQSKGYRNPQYTGLMTLYKWYQTTQNTKGPSVSPWLTGGSG